MEWLFDTSRFVPRALCGDWPTWLIIINIVANLLIAASYYAIPITLLTVYVKRRYKISQPSVIILFVIFIATCGTTHILDAIVFRWPLYRLLTLVDVITAIASVITAIVLPVAAYRFLKTQSIIEMTNLNMKLRKEIQVRAEIERRIQEQNHDLANQVQRLQNIVQTQGWIAEKQMDLDSMKRVITELRKEYARPTNSTS